MIDLALPGIDLEKFDSQPTGQRRTFNDGYTIPGPKDAAVHLEQ